MPHKCLVIGSDPDSRYEVSVPQFVMNDVSRSGKVFYKNAMIDKGRDGKFYATPVSMEGFDIDGTVMPLLHDPSQRRIDPRFLAGLIMKQNFYPGTVVAITGRDFPQVVEVMGGCAPFFPVISSNGADLTLADGTRHSYAFSYEEKKFIQTMKDEMQAFAEHHPHLVTEIKDWSVGFHTAAKQGFGGGKISTDDLADMVTKSSQSALDLLTRFHQEATVSNLNFVIAGAEATNSEIHHGAVNKSESITWYARHLPALPQSNDWKHFNYFGDSLRGHGNDRQVAALTRKNGGTVIMVTNGSTDRIPSEGSIAEPHFGLENPKEVGRLYYDKVYRSVVRDFGLDALRSFQKKNNLSLT